MIYVGSRPDYYCLEMCWITGGGNAGGGGGGAVPNELPTRLHTSVTLRERYKHELFIE